MNAEREKQRLTIARLGPPRSQPPRLPAARGSANGARTGDATKHNVSRSIGKQPRALERADAPSEWALRDLPARVATFLFVLGNAPDISACLATGGYGARDHEEGAALLSAACAYRAPGFEKAADEVARASAAELTAWVRTHLRRLRAALLRLHPEHAIVFAELDTSSEAHSVLAVATCLERVAELERLGEGAQVLAALAQRKFGAAERAHLSVLVKQAQAAASTDTEVKSGNVHREALVRLLSWYSDWCVTARALIQRRDWLARLGIVRER